MCLRHRFQGLGHPCGPGFCCRAGCTATRLCHQVVNPTATQAGVYVLPRAYPLHHCNAPGWSFESEGRHHHSSITVVPRTLLALRSRLLFVRPRGCKASSVPCPARVCHPGIWSGHVSHGLRGARTWCCVSCCGSGGCRVAHVPRGRDALHPACQVLWLPLPIRCFCAFVLWLPERV